MSGIAVVRGVFLVGTTTVQFNATEQVADQTAAETWLNAVKAWLTANATSFTLDTASFIADSVQLL